MKTFLSVIVAIFLVSPVYGEERFTKEAFQEHLKQALVNCGNGDFLDTCLEDHGAESNKALTDGYHAAVLAENNDEKRLGLIEELNTFIYLRAKFCRAEAKAFENGSHEKTIYLTCYYEITENHLYDMGLSGNVMNPPDATD